MPSFDIVSKTDLAEVDNALQNVTREISQRYDFKGSNCSVERKEHELTILADDDLKLKQMHELLQGHLARRQIESGILDYKEPEKAAGQSVRQKVTVREGLDKELAKRIVKDIKGSGLKVQVAIQGDELRVTGKKRDDLQAAIQFVKGLKIEQPLQYENFRD
ncbi:MAG: YajQ family cyclic di-GMP-binding protein [Alphaproteobacteria bacterium HGW-Alphaproteobacteria-12]|nr:MAG: YajQ family cyclic di-GMP-binding protein [Alphaproteobacteria bacterium HGW-Alphaproteobacteria-12]